MSDMEMKSGQAATWEDFGMQSSEQGVKYRRTMDPGDDAGERFTAAHAAEFDVRLAKVEQQVAEGRPPEEPATHVTREKPQGNRHSFSLRGE